MVEDRVKHYIQQECSLQKDDKIIIGLSGGVDSNVLLHMMNSFNLNCIAAHCNFHLRGEESVRDENFARSFAAELNVPFLNTDFNTEEYAFSKKISIEMAARELRYEWFEKIREEFGAKAIAVAHHQDDNIETLFLHLIRGTGIRGLTGIKPKSGNIIRPFLCLKKDEILSYAKKYNLSFVIDSSNLQDNFTRNKLRLQIIPLLQTINPSIGETMIQMMKNLQQVSEVYHHSISAARKEVFNKDSGQLSIPRLKCFVSPEALLYEILSEYNFNAAVIKEAYSAIDSQSGKEFYSKTHRLFKDRDYFILTSQLDEGIKVYEINQYDKLIKMPVTMQITYEKYSHNYQLLKGKHVAYFDADKLIYPLTIRKWEYGDRFVPFGMKNTQKLSNYFNNHKFSKLDKENSWILCSGEDIIWIVGERTDNRYRLDEGSKSMCIIELF